MGICLGIDSTILYQLRQGGWSPLPSLSVILSLNHILILIRLGKTTAVDANARGTAQETTSFLGDTNAAAAPENSPAQERSTGTQGSALASAKRSSAGTREKYETKTRAGVYVKRTCVDTATR